jgi:hypothetical protein
MEKQLLTLAKSKHPHQVWKLFTEPSPDLNKLKVLIINAPCMGYGDIVFASKFSSIVKKWYECDIKILTTQKKAFMSLGFDPENIYEMKSTSKESNCRRLKLMRVYRNGKQTYIPDADLIFVAPLQADFDPDINDVQKIARYSNRFNTFFVSEYNDVLTKKIDFNTGVGGKRLGLLFTDEQKITNPGITNPFCVIYVAKTISRVKSCIVNFVSMVGKKHSDSNFEIVIPDWVESENILIPICTALQEYFGTIKIRTKQDEKTTHYGNGNTATIRMDIFPVPNDIMLGLIKYSAKDILVTGDQSITDALSCCTDKNIFYQTAPWKENFAKNLAKELPNKWLMKKSESCGGLPAIGYQSKYQGFKERWDFRTLAKPKMDCIFNYTAAKNKNRLLRDYEYNILTSRNPTTASEKVKKILTAEV